MWLRLAGALLVTLAAIGALEYFGVSRLLGGRSPDEPSAAYGPSRELFWLAIFFVVMATSLLAAARRVAGRLRQAVRVPSGRRRPG
jgi:hypothetical protein